MSAPALRIVCTFQSTLSVRRATTGAGSERGDHYISIHALREESDDSTASSRGSPPYFNPRSP